MNLKEQPYWKFCSLCCFEILFWSLYLAIWADSYCFTDVCVKSSLIVLYLEPPIANISPLMTAIMIGHFYQHFSHLLIIDNTESLIRTSSLFPEDLFIDFILEGLLPKSQPLNYIKT